LQLSPVLHAVASFVGLSRLRERTLFACAVIDRSKEFTGLAAFVSTGAYATWVYSSGFGGIGMAGVSFGVGTVVKADRMLLIVGVEHSTSDVVVSL